LKVTLSGALATTVTATIAAGGTAKLDSMINTLISPTPNVQFFVRVEPNGTVGATGAYTLTPSFSYNSTPRKTRAKALRWGVGGRGWGVGASPTPAYNPRMTYKTLLVDEADGVLTVTLNRPTFTTRSMTS